MLQTSFVLLFFLLFCIPANAGAWLRHRGGAQAIYQVSYSEARRSFGPETVLSFHKTLVKSYTEYAVSRKITAFSEPQYTIAKIKSVYGIITGRDYAMRTGVRVGILSGTNRLSLEASYQYGQAFALTVSDGVANSQQAELRLLYGRNFFCNAHKVFVDLEGFWRWTAPPRPNEAGADVTLGLSLFSDTQILLQSFSVLSAGYGARTYTHYALHKAELSVVQHLFHGWNVQLGGIYAYSGRNVVAERGLSLAFWVLL